MSEDNGDKSYSNSHYFTSDEIEFLTDLGKHRRDPKEWDQPFNIVYRLRLLKLYLQAMPNREWGEHLNEEKIKTHVHDMIKAIQIGV